MATLAVQKYQDDLFFPQPGDIILCPKPTVYTDGTLGSHIRIYKDNFHFESKNSFRKAVSKPQGQTHEFARGEKILRLFQLYRNWEFVPNETHRLLLFYPGYAANWSWFTVDSKRCGQHLKAVKALPKARFTHMSPSKIFSSLPQKEFTPQLGDIVVRTHPPLQAKPQPAQKDSDKCAACKKRKIDDKCQNNSVPFVSEASSSRNDQKSCPCCCAQVESSPPPSDTMRVPWEERCEILYWKEDMEFRKDDALIRYAIDTQYDEGKFKKTHLQVELFAFVVETKEWKYLGMDVAQFGPTPEFQDIIYHPQPGDIIISRAKKWGVLWDGKRNTGGFVMFHRDPGYFGDQERGQNLWAFPGEGQRRQVRSPPAPVDSWLVRLGSFDEYWDFHVNDLAEVFLIHPNCKTMHRHYSVDYQHMVQSPNYRFDEHPPSFLTPHEVEPNHWDLIIRRTKRTKDDDVLGLKTAEWLRDPNFWMKDPLMWGTKMPPRYDKDVEIHTYWSGFAFEDHDLLLRAGYELGTGPLPGPRVHIPQYTEQEPSETPYGPRNPDIPPVPTAATVELYEVRMDGDDPPEFTFFGRDKFRFPTEEKVKDPVLEHRGEDEEDAYRVTRKPRKGHGKASNDKGKVDGKSKADAGSNEKSDEKKTVLKSVRYAKEKPADEETIRSEDEDPEPVRTLKVKGPDRAALP